MLAELRTKSQITLPKNIVNSLGLSEGDKFEIYEENGVICLVPMSVCPKKYVDDLQSELKEIKSAIESGKRPTLKKIDNIINKLNQGN